MNNKLKSIICMILSVATITSFSAIAFASPGVGTKLDADNIEQLSHGVDNQVLERVQDVGNGIILEFRVSPYIAPTQIIPESMESSPEYNTEPETVSIEYPVSTGISPMAATGSYRLQTLSSKATALVERGSKSAATFSAAKGLFIMALSINYPLQAAILDVANWFSEAVNASKPVTGKIYTSHETLTKQGEIANIAGNYMPWCKISKRLYYRHQWSTYTDSKGYLRQRTRDFTPSTGYGAYATDTKAHYNDNAWIKEKAIAGQKAGWIYTDVH